VGVPHGVCVCVGGGDSCVANSHLSQQPRLLPGASGCSTVTADATAVDLVSAVGCKGVVRLLLYCTGNVLQCGVLVMGGGNTGCEAVILLLLIESMTNKVHMSVLQ